MSQREVWNSLAESWRRLRSKPLPEVLEFLKDRNRNDTILDVGCGAGRNFLAGYKYVAIDIAEKQLLLAKQRAKEVGAEVKCMPADARALPFPEGSFETALAIAVIHCIEGREKAAKEIYRVLKKNGRALITVWNKSQPRFFFSKKESHVPWKVGDKTYQRYYYLFTKNELKKLLEKAGFRIISIHGSSDKAFKLFPKNIVAIVEKP